MTNRKGPGLLLGGIGVALAAAAACSNYVPPDVGTYGPPGALSGKSPPVPAVEDAGSGGSNEDAGGGTSGEGGGSSAQYACEAAGKMLVDGGACSVSFATNIYPNMMAAGTWGCASTSCHGGTQPPILTGTSAGSFYAVLANFTKLSDGKGLPYFDPCSTDPTQSDFVCNTTATNGCGSPMPLAKTLSATDTTTIATWVACGAPNN